MLWMDYIGLLLIITNLFFSKNPRLNMMVRTLERMNVERKKIIFDKADEFIENVTYI